MPGKQAKVVTPPMLKRMLRHVSRSTFPDRDRAFRSITGRLPFQMALTLLRIARNAWVSAPHRERLVEEAKIILRTP